ncbi:hypothetical protein COV04_04425 [Candidatus Uhrbacteria bacterium CG10_big_fil_rev_8_21_14_0_10_48_11]|uniref:Host attachment protein n=1 Tax=Candidatus Uhrbacteria bacterium CG10_big_fil_rev_8_21_14_0_10_48_11 TaxID=1975037 RepID=A0A2M8LDJ5_9BACT|nr:MAG: hypothetical protein COV04_04425 [Candidatus Uhrbacteria bacterium CG10_big_fil_rev_8_21_14_0_10_48_11]
MKIGKQYPQFTNAPALIIVTGKQEAEFYRAKNGEMSLVGTFEVRPPRFSDKEGFFGARGSGGKAGAGGSVREEPKIAQQKEFLKKLKAEVTAELGKLGYKEVYLYAPQYLMAELKSGIKKIVGARYTMSFTGNYLKMHPTKLLAMLENRVERKAAKRKVVPTTREANKILQKGK